MLGTQHHSDIAYETLPRTLLIYGEKDHIVSPLQGKHLHQHIQGSQLQIWDGCAHAPHLHDAPKLRAMIEAFAGIAL